MLISLEINNIALIDRVRIDAKEAMTVLTGETGAGKSIIIDSVNLILGARANKGLIRYGEDKARVQALFSVSESVEKKLFELGIEVEDGMVAVLRDITSDGRSICRINGMIVTQNILRDAAELLVNIHGQQDNQSLLNPKFHLSYLDGFAGNYKELDEYTKQYNICRELKARLDRLNTNEKERAERIDLLRYQTEEISSAGLSDGEKEQLLEERVIIQNAEEINEAVAEAKEYLYDGEEVNAYDLVSRAANAISRLSDIESAAKVAEKIFEIKYEIEDVASEVRSLADGVEFSRARLDEIEDRIDLIGKLEKKYGGSESAVLEYLEAAEKELMELDIGEEAGEKLAIEYNKATEKLAELAKNLTETRKCAGKKLSAEIEKSLSELDMPGTRFVVDVKNAEFTKTGADVIEFLICPNVGEELKPLAKFASGGELSRVMLAMKSILADADDAETLIFDEIDTGVSGSAAQKIAKKLSSLGKKKQVICVSHQPQLAVSASTHLYIKKNSNGERTTTTVKELDYNERIREVARIIDGNNPSDAALAHAKAMIDNA
ncbi:MAG: DNA repair protein RecN [Eubacteriales bacterium]|nr:DNA repair protein RecN [Eubacteriales bacterium]